MAIAVITGLFAGYLFSYVPLSLSLFLLLASIVRPWGGLVRTGRVGRYLLPIAFFTAFLIYPVVSIPHSSSDLRSYVGGDPVRIVAQVTGPPQFYPNRIVLQMKAIVRQTPDGPRPVRGRFRLTFYRVTEIPFEYGDRLAMEVSLRWPRTFLNPGVFDREAYAQREGTSGVTDLRRVDLARKVGEGGSPLLKRLYRARERLRRQIAQEMTGEPAGILMAMLLGQPGGLTPALREIFASAGVVHLLSVSGSHLAFVSLLFFGGTRQLLLHLPAAWLLRLSLWAIPSQWAALATVPPLVFYTFLAGAQVATLRSLTMLLIYLLSVWLRRAGEAKTSLSVAALLILADDPLALFDLSFQFSFLSVLALILTTERWGLPGEAGAGPTIPGDVEGWVASLRLMFQITVGTTLALTPLTLYYFHSFSWIGLLANAIAIPVAGIFIVPLGLVSVVISFFTGSFPWPALHQQLGAGFFRLLAFFADLPGAGMKFPSPPLWEVALFYGGIVWLYMRRAPGWTFVFATALLLVTASYRATPDALRIAFLDVGPGDATVIEFPEGQVMLVDGGAGGDFDVGAVAVAPYLWQRGIRRIDEMIGTHPQNDHMGGLANLVRTFDVGRIWTNGTESRTLFYSMLKRSMNEKGLIERVAHDGLSPLAIGQCRIDFLNRLQPAAKNRNDRSVVFRLHCPAQNDFSLLMTGDIERKGQQALLQRASSTQSILRSVLLKVPHHGSRGAIDTAFLATVAPRVAVLSAGRRNRYGHPHAETLSAYARQGIALYQTSKRGAVVVEVTQNRMSIRTSEEARPRPVDWHAPILPQEWKNLKRLFDENFGEEIHPF